MYQNDPCKVLTGEVRLSYAHLTEPRASQQGGDTKYSVTLLIPKTDTATKADIDQAVQAAIIDGMQNKWNGVQPPRMDITLYDGDLPRPKSGEPFGAEAAGCWVLNASSKQRPQVVHQSNINAELLPADIYSGMYARVTVRFYAYNTNGNRGIGCGLGNVMKTRDGDPLGGGSSAADDFAGIGQAAPAQPAYSAPPAAVPAYPMYPAQSMPVSSYPAYPQPIPTAPQIAIDPITGLPAAGVPQ